nr:sulfotransferase family 2 domain-containing protein [Yoonia litorea]
MQVTGQTAFQLDYDDLQDVEVLNGLLGFLQSQNKLGRIKKKIKKQNPESQKIKIKNFDEMSETLKEVDWFGLWGMSSFEPQRGPSIPSYIAAGRSGLLYAPLKSGPDAAVKEWLERLDGVQPLAKFTQRSLREWYEQHLPHRSFTVVRHPVARAHAAFCDRILIDKNGRFAEIRANLRRVHKLPIPQEAPSMTREDGYDLEAHKTAFAAFLKFLRLNISGQTSIRVDPTWASQHALLHGVTQFACPDAVLREEELHTALPSLAAAIGKSGVPEFINARHPYQDWLDEIYDLEIEKAARAAYARDYEIFGFRDWA